MSAAAATRRAALTLAGFALLAAALLTAIHAGTRERIRAAEERARRTALSALLPADYDNDPLVDRVRVQAPMALGRVDPVPVHRARRAGRPLGMVLEASAPDGYGGPIALLIGIDDAGRVVGVRVLRHAETPGLGDGIETTKSDWIGRFVGRSLGDPPVERWTVRPEGGDFDAFAGATLTPRAVVHAVRRALAWHGVHGAAVMAAESGTTLALDLAPAAGTPR